MPSLFRGLVFSLAAVGAVVFAGPAGADQGRTALSITETPSSAPPPNYFLFWNGVVDFGFAYNDSIFVALLSDRSADHRLFIPVVGPWLDLGQRDCASMPCKNEGLSTALLIVDGVSQGVGAALIAASFFVRDQTVTIRMGNVRIAPVAAAGREYGAVAWGSF